MIYDFKEILCDSTLKDQYVMKIFTKKREPVNILIDTAHIYT